MFEKLTHNIKNLRDLELNLRIGGTHMTEVESFSNFITQQTQLQTLTIVYDPHNLRQRLSM